MAGRGIYEEYGVGSMVSRPHHRRGGIRGRQTRTAWLFLLPALAALAAVGIYPLLRTLYTSLTRASFYTETGGFIGLRNYGQLLHDATYLRAVWNSLYFTVVSVAVEIVLGIGFALIINARFRGRQLARAANLLPFVIPLTVASQLWKWMYHDVFGVINDFLVRLHLIAQPVAWLDNSLTAMPSIIAVAVWKFTPFVTLLILAGLQAIPEEVYESASIDGANKPAQFFTITLPMLKNTIVVASVFRMLDAIRVFDLIYVMKENAKIGRAHV